jgi:ubiquinone/menaquinone biosynthesis C-methylase UbiE
MTRSAGTDPDSARRDEPGHEPAAKPNSVESVRENYDRVAGGYARSLFHELEGKPLDRELLLRFAAKVKGRGPVCDMGCGPGQIARFLGDAGANVSGLDLSPQMIAQARRLNPDIEFQTGNMLALDLPDSSLAGITAFYAIVNIPRESHAVVFRELFRVLQSEGLLLLAFHIGDQVLRPQELWGQRIAMEFYHLQLQPIQTSLVEAGFEIKDIVERDPYPDVEFQSRRAYVFARKPAESA